MGTKAVAPFSIEGWEEDVYDERPGARLSRTRITKTFTGDFIGTSEAETLMCGAAVEGSAAYVGFERFLGSLHGRAGTFVLHHTATGSGGQRGGSWTIVPDTGTDELTGISGAGEIVIAEDGAHTLVLAYELG
ncbi:DUF3224 domain-containing protein [Dactylosporangium siamense]|uniref:DUF3224 domain-containing protein n=1 Tax=Dactylosporangium siamense TaxID=685454 RepID=A0A919PJ69_9ACTN|nr:DUF3224 domain-containing protein [Dactylosporangium siamense]GIG45766.1 hypothetical protein Dsi01nite_038070 [Dactylosporangium siamense]